MSLYFLDTSALTKLYVRESGTDFMLELANAEPAHRLALLSVTPIELRSAVRRRQRMGDLLEADAEQILATFSVQLESLFLRQPLTEAVVEIASSLVDRHALRAYDALQLAGCLALKMTATETMLTFVSADEQLNIAADREGVQTKNPLHAPGS